jgi:hypothetical protein
MLREAATLLAVVAAVGCDGERQRIVVLDAPAIVREEAVELCVIVCDGDGTRAKDECRPAAELEWPARIPVTARAGDPERTFGVTATLTTRGGAITVRAAGDFRGPARAEISVAADSACGGVVCPPHETCMAGACAPVLVQGAALVAADADRFFGCLPPVADAGVDGGIDAARPPGYMARECGFDLDDDGVIGEPEDDCRICDGATRDPDGDGIDEDFVYVDCAGGADVADCGAPETPCLTLAHALTRLDGPSGSREDIVCITGRCTLTEDVTLAIPGVDGATPAEPALPVNPLVIAGWDHDANGVYPPMDDQATLAGPLFGIVLESGSHHVELAHLAFEGFGEDAPRGTSIALLAVHPDVSHVYVHDVALRDAGRNACADDGIRIFDFLGSDVTVANVECLDCGSSFFLVRGARAWIEHATHRALAASRGSTTPECSLPVGWLAPVRIRAGTDVAILRSLLDMNPTAWLPDTREEAVAAVSIDGCSGEVLVAQNELLDYKRFASVRSDCAGATGFVFEDNRYVTSYENGSSVFRLGGTTIEGIIVRRNYMETTVGAGGVLGRVPSVFEISPGPGTTAGPENAIVDNVAVVNLEGAPPIAWLSLSTLASPWIVRGNRIDSIGTGGAPNVLLGADVPADFLDSDCNQFDSSLVFTTPTLMSGDLDAWRMDTGLDANSIACASLEACEPPCP